MVLFFRFTYFLTTGHKRTYNNRSKDKNRGQFGERNKETHKDVDDNSPIIKAFQHYALEIDEKHDRYERLVKISRDITIESKRIIFLLHNVDKYVLKKYVIFYISYYFIKFF